MPKNRLLVKREVETYARVLLDAAREAGTVREVSEQLGEFQSVLLTHPGLRDTLRDASVDAQVRENILKEVFTGFDPALVKVLRVMAERKDMGLIHRVVETFDRLAEEALGSVLIDVTTVVELDDALRGAIKEKFAAQFGKDVALREHVDPSILGGIVLSAHGKRIDASVSTQLDRVREALSSTRSGGER